MAVTSLLGISSRLICTKQRRCLRRSISDFSPGCYPSGFSFWPSFFSVEEQRTLLDASLYKLDATETRSSRRKRKDYWKLKQPAQTPSALTSLSERFAPDELYEFQEGHYDGVIHHFREMHLSSWPVEEYEGLNAILDHLNSLCPTKLTQTHLLHLASYGDILPHIDNISASGSWILGVSLGAERILRMKEVGSNNAEFALLLPSGSVYLQRDDIRFKYMHSIERHQAVGQRLSIMIRDQNTDSLSLS